MKGSSKGRYDEAFAGEDDVLATWPKLETITFY